MATTTVENPLTLEYNRLTPKQQASLKADFQEEYGYGSASTFYKKMRGDSEFSPSEKKWLSKKFNRSVNRLFPKEIQKL